MADTVIEYIAGLEPLPDGLTLEQQWRIVRCLGRRLAELCAGLPEAARSEAAKAAYLQMSPWPKANKKQGKAKP